VDSGLAARLLRLTELKLGQATASALTEFGHLLETFVVGEVCKQLDWLDATVARGHWRTHDGDEVDLVIEREDGMLVAVEVKAASRVSARELRSLLKLRARLGSRFMGGVVLHTGARAYTLLPVGRLWQSGPARRRGRQAGDV
jgi:predicted AAA+ superfamily ATPase